MIPDAMGFKYPRIEESACIECGLCEKVCAFNRGYEPTNNYELPYVYALRHKDGHTLATSRSGGAFVAVSDWILAQNGVVYGAGYTDHFRVVHKRAACAEERDEFKGSKYVQSDPGTTFLQVKADLDKGLKVLFSGTPCQTAGLRAYIGGKKADGLYLIDIICHGTPSPNLWRDYLKYIETKYKAEITRVDFRDKTQGWTAHKESFIFDTGDKIITDIWKKLFYRHLMLRPSCGNCPYTNFKRPSDITIGDFWGWEKTDPTFNSDNKGCSLVLVNTEKGRQLFNDSSNSFVAIPSDTLRCVQPNLQRPTQLSELSDEFVEDYINSGIEYIVEKYATANKTEGMLYYLKKIRNFIRNKYRKNN